MCEDADVNSLNLLQDAVGGSSQLVLSSSKPMSLLFYLPWFYDLTEASIDNPATKIQPVEIRLLIYLSEVY